VSACGLAARRGFTAAGSLGPEAAAGRKPAEQVARPGHDAGSAAQERG